MSGRPVSREPRLPLALGFACFLGLYPIVVHCVLDIGKLISDGVLDLNQGIFDVPTVAAALGDTNLMQGPLAVPAEDDSGFRRSGRTYWK
jgi:hypothetical protein